MDGVCKLKIFDLYYLASAVPVSMDESQGPYEQSTRDGIILLSEDRALIHSVCRRYEGLLERGYQSNQVLCRQSPSN